MKEKKKLRPIVKLNVVFYPWNLEFCPSVKRSISDKSRKAEIENHIEKYSGAWQELATK